MLALGIILLLTTLLLCYAGYMFLVVDKKESQQMLENPELYDELDDKDYHFDLPAEIDEYEDVRASKPTDKCAERLQHLPALAARTLSPHSSVGILAHRPTSELPTRRRTLPVALLKRAMADIPRIEVRRAAPLSPARCRESHTPCGPRSNSRRTIRGWRVSSTAACCRLASGSSFSRPRP